MTVLGPYGAGEQRRDDPGPEDVRRAAAEAVLNGYNQYPSMMGIPELRTAIAAHYKHWQGVDLKPYYPDGAAPVIRGESVNTATTYGYDSVTMMQETKTTLCQIERAA